MEDKYCVICGAKIENPRLNAKTCCDPECMRKYRIKSTRENQLRRWKDPKNIALRNAQANSYYHRNKNRVTKLEQTVLSYKAKELTAKLKDTYFAGGCGGENLDKLLNIVEIAIVDSDKIEELIADLENAELI